MSNYIKPYQSYFEDISFNEGLDKLQEGWFFLTPTKFLHKLNDLVNYTNRKAGYKMFRVHDIGNIVELHILYHNNYMGQVIFNLEDDHVTIEKNDRNDQFIKFQVGDVVEDEQILMVLKVIGTFNYEKLFHNPTQNYKSKFSMGTI